MKVYYFGNRDVNDDDQAYKVKNKLEGEIEDLEFIEVKPNEDLPFVNDYNVYLMDVVEGIKKVTLINESDLENIKLTESVSVHDFDLGFQLKYLKKLGKLKRITIIGIPKGKKINYLRIHSIFRKLVEQDIQGS